VIESVEPSSGSVKGGTLIKIKGRGFKGFVPEKTDPNLDVVTVSINGDPCKVVESDPSEIQCITSEPTTAAIGTSKLYLGERGAKLTSYPNLPNAISVASMLVPSNLARLRQYSYQLIFCLDTVLMSCGLA
jgi:hypothetical protein